jgi:hypothetical protein
MRRRRQGLRPDTFPFLAVLLCAMGSLILLLLVLDRRARAVALGRAQAAAARRTAAEEQAAAARRAEWERRRQALHALLEQEDNDVRAEIQGVLGRIEAAGAGISAGQARHRELRNQAQAAQIQLTRGHEELAARHQEAAETDRRSAASRAELARMAADLEQLEATLAELKAARKRQQQTYSLVPYRGRHGDNRRPLYVECTRRGLVFHPDRLALEGPGVSFVDVRGEIERRIRRQRDTVVAAGGKPDAAAYLLLLVRPDGILNYYRTLAALKGLDIDFGYEFIDRDWVLEFPKDENAPAPQPWMTAAEPTPKPVPRPAGTGRRYAGVNFGGAALTNAGSSESEPRTEQVGEGGPRPGEGTGPYMGPSRARSESSSGVSGPAQGPLGPLADAPRAPPGRDAAGPAGNAMLGPPTPLGADASRRGDTPGTGPATGLRFAPGEGLRAQNMNPTPGPGVHDVPAAPGQPGAGGPGSSAFPGVGGARPSTGAVAQSRPPGPGSAPGTPTGAIGGTPALAPGLAQETWVGAGSYRENTGSSAGASPPGQAGPTASGAPVAGNGGPGPSATAGGPAGNPPAAGGPSSGDPAGGTGATGPAPTGVAASLPPAPGNRPENAPPAGAGGSPPLLPLGVPSQAHGTAGATGGGRPPDEPGGPDLPTGAASNPLARMLPNEPTRRGPRPLPFRAGPLNPDRNWLLAIECRADGLLLPTGRRIAASELSPAAGAASPLFEAVQQLIARKQATVRPGEPPYRPRIRFLVRPDGFRTYYLAYPALEPLGLPMTRENLDPLEDDKKPGHQ